MKHSTESLKRGEIERWVGQQSRDVTLREHQNMFYRSKGDNMTELESAPRARGVAYAAFVISLLTTVGMWLTILTANNEEVFLNIGLIAVGLVIGVIAGIALDIVAGVLGGRNRVLAIIGGALLLSPVLLLIFGLIRGLFLAPAIANQ